MRALRAAAVVSVLALLGLLVWDLAHQNGPGVAISVDKGKAVPAPKLVLPRLNGSGNLSLASLRGKVVVVNFWQSSCYPCKLEARDIASASRDWADKGVVFLGVDAQDLKSAGRAYMKRYGVTYPNVRDAIGKSWPTWGVSAVPETFFVDRRGRVVPPHIIGKASRERIDEGIRRAKQS
ncbi:MAG: cytochrome c biosis protein CcmG, thiol:disulfide interchange protein DsbE [Gaiellaceae bacterium]|jgi:cytochrome c biogenesis protein CcmG/thiol:disulfide interchange protein DsbE|nr:cytochrome c biosis protein CcmG, thiol:disulfide interchange protein DsbE [Gaiellaceae bacterium]